jgi:predicted nucleotidyltransferase
LNSFLAKDFIETPEGLLFAVVASGIEDGRVLCFLRYLLDNGYWRKVDSDTANQHLHLYHPDYLYDSPVLDATLHGVELHRIVRHYQPRQILQQLLIVEPADAVIADLQQLCRLLSEHQLPMDKAGVTGSLLVGMQKHASDIDLVFYDREIFHRARVIVQDLIAHNRLQALNDEDWLEAYQRRACDFPLDEYIWHEQRKYNKAMINQRKFDLSLVVPVAESIGSGGRKLGMSTIEAKVTDDDLGFDYPARFAIDHAEIAEVICFTATYSGQAQRGERVAVAGQVEVDACGCRRIVVGSSREAIGEYIRVLR